MWRRTVQQDLIWEQENCGNPDITLALGQRDITILPRLSYQGRTGGRSAVESGGYRGSGKEVSEKIKKTWKRTDQWG